MTCTYDYEVTVHAARGAKYALSDVHAFVKNTVQLFCLQRIANASVQYLARAILNNEAFVYVCIYLGEFPKTSNEGVLGAKSVTTYKTLFYAAAYYFFFVSIKL